MALNFRDCILGHIAEGRVPQSRGNDLLQRYDAHVERLRQAGRSEEAAAFAAEELLKTEARTIEQRQRNLRQHALKQAEINEWLENTPGSMPDKVADLYQRASFRGEGIKRSAYAFMDKVADQLKANFFETSRDYKTFVDGVRAALGEGAATPEAQKLGDVIRQTLDYLHSRYRAAGGTGPTESHFPQVHRKEAIRKTSKAEWVNFTYDRLNREAMIDEATSLPYTDDKLRALLETEYDSIVTAGRSDLQELSKKGEAPARGRKEPLPLQFRNADAFLEYNGRFGTGDEGLIDAFLGAVDQQSRQIGVLELLGPRPQAMNRFLDFKMNAAGGSQMKRKWVNAQFRVLTSRFDAGDPDAVWWKVLNGAQNFLRSAMLGSASISAISDTAYIAATSKINGLSATRTLSNYVKILAPGDREAKQIARRSGFIVETIQGSVLSETRFAGEAMTGKVTGWLAGLTNKLSGLGAMTKATQDSISLEGMATIAEQLAGGVVWKDLNADLKASLQRFGVNAKDWADLSNAKLMNQGDAKFLVTSDLRVDDAFDSARAKELADKLDDWIMSLRQAAANEATLSTRALTTGAIFGDGAPGTASRAIASSLFMFKSFPITSITTHMIPAIKRAAVHRKYDHLAYAMLGSTVLGAAAMQLKEVIKGKTPKDMNDYKFWRGAFLQGGGVGLFGDFLLGDYSRNGRTPITEAMGPVVGLFEDIYQATKGNLDRLAQGEDQNTLRDLFRVAKRNIPLGSLWYGRLAMERLILDNLERLVDPNFDRRMRTLERKLTKDSGQQFWWAPGDEPDARLVLGE